MKFTMNTRGGRIGLLAFLSTAFIITLLFFGPIAQDINYHHFADTRAVGGIGNFWNVASNMPFVIVGIFGLVRYFRLSQPETGEGYLVLCISVILVGFGSAYYHYAPTNASLLWDRLPMTVAFMALFSLLLDECVLRTPSRHLLWILVFAGITAALYWAWTESSGQGDLRPYILVQFLPILLMPLILFLFPRRHLSNAFLVGAFALYLAAKLLEHFDASVYLTLGYGGHAIKHLLAALAVLCVINAVPVRSN